MKQRAGEFNSFRLPHQRLILMKIVKMMKFIIFDPLELDLSYSAMFKVTRRAFKL